MHACMHGSGDSCAAIFVAFALVLVARATGSITTNAGTPTAGVVVTAKTLAAWATLTVCWRRKLGG